MKKKNPIEVLDRNKSNLNSDNMEEDIIEKLQNEKAKIEDSKKEERFFWICFTVILINCLMFPHSKTSIPCIVIVFMQVPFLMFIADALGLETVSKFLKGIWKIIENKYLKKK